MSDCIFCKIVRGELPAAKVYEDEKILAFLDIKPVNPGHTLVITKTHFADLLDAPEEELSAIMAVVKKIAPAVLKATGSAGFNLEVNNGEAAGQLVPHVHFHIMPRHQGDGHELWHGLEYASGEMSAVAEAIKQSL